MADMVTGSRIASLVERAEQLFPGGVNSRAEIEATIAAARTALKARVA